MEWHPRSRWPHQREQPVDKAVAKNSRSPKARCETSIRPTHLSLSTQKTVNGSVCTLRETVAWSSDLKTTNECEKLKSSRQGLWRSPMFKLSRVGDPRTSTGLQQSHMIISVSGPHGTGKSTYAARLAKALRLRHLSAGTLFRRIALERNLSLRELGNLALKDLSIDKMVDQRTILEAKKGNVVLDGQLTGWILGDKADLRIYLTAPDSIRLERIAKRDRLGVKDARIQTGQRESVQRRRYLRHYGFRIYDTSIYHLILDTSLGSIDDTAKVLLDAALLVRNRNKKAKRRNLK